MNSSAECSGPQQRTLAPTNSNAACSVPPQRTLIPANSDGGGQDAGAARAVEPRERRRSEQCAGAAETGDPRDLRHGEQSVTAGSGTDLRRQRCSERCAEQRRGDREERGGQVRAGRRIKGSQTDGAKRSGCWRRRRSGWLSCQRSSSGRITSTLSTAGRPKRPSRRRELTGAKASPCTAKGLHRKRPQRDNACG